MGFTDDGKPVLDNDMMWAALVAAARVSACLSLNMPRTRA